MCQCCCSDRGMGTPLPKTGSENTRQPIEVSSETAVGLDRKLILNVHPSLLPLFGGKGMYGVNVHRAVIAAGATESGATVHRVDADYDSGAIICQKKVPVAPDDTPETLARRVASIEGPLLVEALNRIASGSVETHSGRVGAGPLHSGGCD